MGCSSSSTGKPLKNIQRHNGCYGKVVPQTIREPFRDNLEHTEKKFLTKFNVLCVLFSSPLAWKDSKHRLHSMEMLDFGDERDTLIQAFKEAQHEVSINFDYATTDSLRTLVTLGCRALHFSGHGNEDYLNLEDGKSGLHIFANEKLKELSSAGDMKLDFVFVSACFSQKAGKAFVEAGVSHVVCVRLDAKILDIAANDFTKAFYRSLALGHTVKRAFEIGKNAVVSSPRVPNSALESDKFILLPEDGNHDIPIFVSNEVSEWPPVKPQLPLLMQNQLPSITHLPLPPEDFQGREVDMHRVIHEIISRRFVTVVGDKSVGKTAVVKAVCPYMTERRVFPAGVVFVRLKDIRTYPNFLYRLRQALLNGPALVANHFKNVLRQCEEEQRDNDRSSRYSPRYSTHGSTRGFFPSASHNDSDNDSVLLEGSVSTLTRTVIHDENQEQTDYLLQESLKASLLDLNMLLVLDHLDNLLSADLITASYVRIFLAELLDSCSKLKILSTCNSCVRLEEAVECGVRENSVSIGPLTLGASLRLYTYLSRCPIKGIERENFVRRVLDALPIGQESVSIHSSDLSQTSSCVLKVLGSGYPARIIELAEETDDAEIREIIRIIQSRQSLVVQIPIQREANLALPSLTHATSEDTCWQPQRDTKAQKKSDTDMLLDLLSGDSSVVDIESSHGTSWTLSDSPRTICL